LKQAVLIAKRVYCIQKKTTTQKQLYSLREKTGTSAYNQESTLNLIGREYLHCKICAFIFFIVAYTGMSFNF